MASERPRYIMRNANLFLNQNNYIGQASEIGFIELSQITEEIFNAGQEVKIEVPMGYEMPEMGFKMTSFDPTVMKLWGLALGQEVELMATAALRDDDGTVHSQVAYMRGFVKKISADKYKRGDLAESEYEYSFRYYKLEIDGAPIYEIDPFGVSVGGVSQTASIRRALLV